MEIKNAEIGRFNNTLSKVGFSDGETIQSLLNKASLELSEGESINDESGNVLNLTDTPTPNGVYWIVRNFKQGNK